MTTMAIPLSIMARKRSSLSPSSSSALMSSDAATLATGVTSTKNKSTSYHLLTARFDLSRLRIFLLQTIPRYCPYNEDLIHDASVTYQSVHSKVSDDLSHRKYGGIGGRRIAGSTKMTSDANIPSSNTYEACYHELNDCIAILSTFLSSCIEPLTPQTLSEAHYLIGSINETLHQTEQAKQSYIKTLWIIAANSTSDIFSVEALATTLHCLGRTYGALGKHTEAIRILQKAQHHYLLLNVHKDHAVMIEVQKLLGFYERKQVEEAAAELLQHKFHSSSVSVSTLTLILEDESECTE